MSLKLNLAAVAGGLLLATSAMAASGDAGAQPVRPQTKASCLALDEQGRTMPNPNASYGCFQLEAHRSDCEALARAGNTKGLSLHCFGFEAAPQAPSAYTSGPAKAGVRAR